MSHDHSHGHGHDHSHDHATSSMEELWPDDVVVDIGCGDGAALREATGWVKRGRLIGVDVDPAALERARAATAGHPMEDRFTWAEGSAVALPVEDGAATLVRSVQTWHHWGDAEAGLAEVFRALGPGGRVLLVERDHGGRFGAAEGPLGDPARVRAMARAAGFSGVEISRYRDGQTPLLYLRARKPWS